MKGDIDPARALFCHYHHLPSLESGVWLLPCSERACINPLHREMKATRYHLGDPAQLPDIRPRLEILDQALIQSFEGNEDYQFALDTFRSQGRSWAETQTPEMLDLTKEQVSAAFQKMGGV